MLPTLKVKPGTLLIDVLVEIGFAKSKGEARRLILQGAVRLRPITASQPQAVQASSKA